MGRKKVAIPVIIVLLVAGVAGYLLLGTVDGTRGTGGIDGQMVDGDMAYDRVKVEEELFSCPKCKEEEGFRVGFRKGTGKRERMLEVILVCPECGYRFAVGDFHIPSSDPRLFDPSIDAGS
jgi:hypothetical protein